MAAKKIKLSDLQQDPNNLNMGTDRGRSTLKQSLKDLGAGRSILVDKNGYIIAGNKTAAAALDSGFGDAVLIETTGDQVVVVQRTDLDLSTDPKAKKLAVADNRTAEIGLNWDIDALKVVADEIDISWLWSDEEIEGLDGWDAKNLDLPDPGDCGIDDVKSFFGINIECDSEDEQSSLLEKFQREGLKCRALTS